MDGKKFDASKPATHLLPPKALLCVADVLRYGAEKYGEHNWRAVPDAENRYIAAALRHIFTAMTGEQPYDPESGIFHIAHAITSLLFILEMEIDKVDNTIPFLDAPSTDEL